MAKFTGGARPRRRPCSDLNPGHPVRLCADEPNRRTPQERPSCGRGLWFSVVVSYDFWIESETASPLLIVRFNRASGKLGSRRRLAGAMLGRLGTGAGSRKPQRMR